MKIPRACILAAYPFYFLLAVLCLVRLDVEYRVDTLLPGAWGTPYKLPEPFRKAETTPDVLRRKHPQEVSDIIRLGQVPSLTGIDPAAFLRAPSFTEETTEVRPDARYEKEFAFSARAEKARVFLFGDSYLISYDYKPLSFLLNEEAGIPTWRRSYGELGSMETVYSFLSETPAEALRGRYVIFVVSEGSSVWVNRKLSGIPFGELSRYARSRASYYALAKLGIGKDSGASPAAPDTPPLPGVRRISAYAIPGGGLLREDPSHFNPVLFEYRGEPRALGFFQRNLAFATWHEPFIRGGARAVSLENWISRIGRRAREKGALPVVLYIPSKLSAYWPIVGPILDYGKMYAYVSGHSQANRAVRSPEDLRKALPLGIRAWRDVVTRACRREDVGIIDLTDPFREAALRGDFVYRDFDTHWNQRGIDIAKERIERFILGGNGK